MQLTSLHIQNFRVIADTQLPCDRALNYLHGENGAGKTSVLEALHVLASGQSFRSTQLRHLIRRDQGLLRVSAALNSDAGHTHRLGIEKHRNGTTRVRVDGHDVNRVSDLAAHMPLRAVAPDSHALVSGGPVLRRRFVDWGVFHVEQRERFPWRRYARALEQRNAVLKGQPEAALLDAIDEQLAQYGDAIAACRQAYIDRIAALLPTYTSAFADTLAVACQHAQGWRGDDGLAAALQRHRADCLRYRVTSVGPHRGDMVLTVDGKPAREVLSRGQQKAVLYALTLAQADDFHQQGGRRMILLCDDLASELDAARCQAVLERLLGLGHQLFVTGVEPQKVLSDQAARVFHVKQGEVKLVV
ncbi:MAG: DNA replication/repair protein RecF [Pseudomonadota bacterium]